MSSPEIIDIIKNLGVPVSILAYVLWRGDTFLWRLTGKMDKFSEELTKINVSIQQLISTFLHGKG